MEQRKKRIESLSALKLIGVLLLFWWHSPLPKPGFDLGARACEFMFVTSGFLVAYNRIDKPNPARWRDSLSYLKTKLCAMWPLHFLCFLIAAALDPRALFSVTGAAKAVLNVFLLQSWFNNPEVFFAYNGASWFLSSIMFCYFVSPLLLKGLKTTRRAAVTAIIVYAARMLVEVFEVSPYGELARVSIYVFPMIRAAEFYCGMVMYKLCSGLSGSLSRLGAQSEKLLFSLAEPALLGAAVLLIIGRPYWLRGSFVLIYCLVVPVFSFDKGILSRLLGLKPFHIFESIEFEIFMLHKVMLAVCAKFVPRLPGNGSPWTVTASALVLTLVLAALYRRLLSERLSGMMRAALGKFERFLGYSL